MDFYAQIKRPGNRLVALYDSDAELIGKLKQDTEYKFSVIHPRNYQFHKKFYALLNMGFQNQDKYDDFETYRAVMTMRAGFYKTVETGKGVVYLPKSIAFAAMDELEFTELYNKMINLLCKDLDLSQPDIEAELINFM